MRYLRQSRFHIFSKISRKTPKKLFELRYLSYEIQYERVSLTVWGGRRKINQPVTGSRIKNYVLALRVACYRHCDVVVEHGSSSVRYDFISI